MTRNKTVTACSLLCTVGLALAVAGSPSAVQALPNVQFSTSTIANGGCSEGDATTAIDVSIDPNGFEMAAFGIFFSVVPSDVNLVSVTAARGITASGVAGGSQFSFAATFSTNQTAPFSVGTITVQGCVGGGQMVLAKQTYTDADFNDTNVTTPVIAATVEGGGRTPTPSQGETVCDVVPFTGDNAGDFGDGLVDIFDVRAIFSTAQLGIDEPPVGTARFSAMDSVTVDTPPTCGGDGTLDIFDVRQCFDVAQLGVTNYLRTGTGSSCTSVEQPQ